MWGLDVLLAEEATLKILRCFIGVIDLDSAQEGICLHRSPAEYPKDLLLLLLSQTTTPNSGSGHARICAGLQRSHSIIDAVGFSVCLFRCHPICPQGCIFNDPGKMRRAEAGQFTHSELRHGLPSNPGPFTVKSSMFFFLSFFYCSKKRHRSQCLGRGGAGDPFTMPPCHRVLVCRRSAA